MKLARLTMAYFLILTTPASVSMAAEPVCGRAPSVPRGLAVRAGLGAAVWTSTVGEDSRTGVAFSFGAGYEFFSWLAVEATWSAGFHETDAPFPPAPGTFATQALSLGARLTLPLEPFDLFLRGGAGWSWSSPDILVRIDDFASEPRLSWMGGLGFSWHTPRRRIWIGIESSAIGQIGLPSVWIVTNAVIGVTLL